MPVKTIIICDKCGNELQLVGPYHIAKNDMKSNGWKNVKINDEWKIICNKC